MSIKLLFPFSGDSYGGSHISTLAVIDRLDKTKFTPHVVLHEDNKDIQTFFEKYTPDHIGYYPKNLKQTITKPISYLCSIRRAYKYIKAQSIDLVHCDDGPLRHIWFYAAKLARIKYVHGQQTIPRIDLEKKLTYRLYDSSIVCSEAVLAAMPYQKTCHVAYPIIESTSANPEDIKDKHSIQTICYVANMRHQKRPMIFVKTAEKLIKKYPDLSFKMIGSLYDEESRQIGNYIEESGLSDHISMQEFSDKILSAIEEADIIMVPAVGDAFGRTVVEAMSVGTVVIAAKSGGHENIIQDGATGFLIPPDDIEAFLECIERLIQSPEEVGKIRSQAFTEVHSKYASDKSVAIHEAVYTKLYGSS